MTEIIATVGPAIANKNQLNKLIDKNVLDYWVNYGLKKNSLQYIRLICELKNEKQVPLKLYLELPSNRCRHVKQKGEIKEDYTYRLYDEDADNIQGDNYLVMSGLMNILDCLEIGEKIIYEDGLCIVSVKGLDTAKKKYISVICDKACDNSSGKITEGSAVSFDGTDKNFTIIREKDINFLKKLYHENLIPDFFSVSFCKNRNDVEQARHIIEKIFERKIRLLAKIQSNCAVEYVDEIIESTEGIVIERGDLLYTLKEGSYLPQVQHYILKKAKQRDKIAIVSSGFMSEYSRTAIMNRAEQSDVYRLYEEGGEYLLLTRETGKAPHAIATVDAIQKIMRSLYDFSGNKGIRRTSKDI